MAQPSLSLVHSSQSWNQLQGRTETIPRRIVLEDNNKVIQDSQGIGFGEILHLNLLNLLHNVTVGGILVNAMSASIIN